MNVSSTVLKWAMRLYPPMLFQRIWVMRFAKDFTSVEVKVNKSLLNRNYNGTIFGGSIFSAADPFYAILFDQIFQRKGYKTIAWLKSAKINFLKPGKSDLYFKISLSDEDIREAEHLLNEGGKFVKTYLLEIKDKKGEVCAVVQNEIYLRNLQKTP